MLCLIVVTYHLLCILVLLCLFIDFYDFQTGSITVACQRGSKTCFFTKANLILIRYLYHFSRWLLLRFCLYFLHHLTICPSQNSVCSSCISFNEYHLTWPDIYFPNKWLDFPTYHQTHHLTHLLHRWQKKGVFPHAGTVIRHLIPEQAVGICNLKGNSKREKEHNYTFVLTKQTCLTKTKACCYSIQNHLI